MAKVHVELFMPLCLQLFSKQADFGPSLFMLLFLQQMLAYAIVAARGYLCRPRCMLQKLTGIQEKLQDYSIYDSKQDNKPVQKGC